jgi:chorismate mutase/prephenate dehydratase
MFSLILRGATTSNGDMTKKNEIARIRAQIDDIDVTVHDMLMRRVALAEEMAIAKDQAAAGQARMRPGREATILRDLFARHQGPLAFPVVARIWRELINANLRVEGDFRVALFSIGDDDIPAQARAQYGDLTPYINCDTADAALTQARNNRDTIAVLPATPGNTWWTALLSEANASLKIIACLPFVRQTGDTIVAVSVGALDREETGDDVSLAIVECSSEELNAPGIFIIDQNGTQFLVGIGRYLAPDDNNWNALKNFEAVENVTPVGGFANPIIVDAEA